jgi:nucleoid-associated protein YgaU
VIAGRAGPDETVEILLDGTVIATAETDATGAFATVLEIAPSGEARELVLRGAGGGAAGTTLAGMPAAGASGTAGQPAAETLAAGPEAAAPAPPGPAGAPAAEPSAATAGETELAAAPAAPSAATPPPAAVPQPAAGPAAGRVAPSLPAPDTAMAPADAGASAGAPSAVPPPAAQAAAESAQPTGAPVPAAGTAVSAPLVILPGEDAASAPAVVRADDAAVTLLQPGIAVSGAGIVLDRITYEEAGAIVAAGRGRPGAVIRVYANAEFLAEARCDQEGNWQARIPRDVAEGTLLLRFDEIGADGKVRSRLETPFEYAPAAVVHELRNRRIVVQKGDYLWKFAEQYYGRGIRYSVIYQANKHLIRDPDLIYPGQVFTVPELVNSE